MTETEVAATMAWLKRGKARSKVETQSAVKKAAIGDLSMKRVEELWGVGGSGGGGEKGQGEGKGGVGGLMGQVSLSKGQKAQRSWVRMLLALSEGKKSETGAMAELVICSTGPKR